MPAAAVQAGSGGGEPGGAGGTEGVRQPARPAARVGVAAFSSLEVELAARLAAYAAEGYHGAGSQLGELCSLAALAAAGAAAPGGAAALHRGLQLAEALMGRATSAPLLAPEWRRSQRRHLVTQQEGDALRQVKQRFHLSGLLEAASAAAAPARGLGAAAAAAPKVTCPRHDPGLPALADLPYSEAPQLRAERRKQTAAERGLGASGAAEVLAVDGGPALQAAAFYVFQLAAAAVSAQLALRCAAGSAGVASAAAAPPGLRARSTGEVTNSYEAAAALAPLAGQFQLLARARRLQARDVGLGNPRCSVLLAC